MIALLHCSSSVDVNGVPLEHARLCGAQQAAKKEKNEGGESLPKIFNLPPESEKTTDEKDFYPSLSYIYMLMFQTTTESETN